MSEKPKGAVPSPAIPDAAKKFPAMQVPPKGIQAFQLARDTSHWAVWAFRVTPQGDIETEKVLSTELFEVCRMKVAELTITAQMAML